MAAPPSTRSAAPAVARRTDDRYPWIAMAVVLVGTFMVILDTTIVNVALPQIGRDLRASNRIEWVVTAYLLAVALSTPASGWLADRFGRKRIFMVSQACFAAGSLLAALSANLPMLVLFRVLQGLGGGAMMPVGMAMIYELFPPDRRGTALGIWGVAAMAAPAMGPVLGGTIATTVSWRWLFLVNVPLGVVGLLSAKALLRDTGYREHRRFDGLGLALAAAALIALLLGFSEGADWSWGSPAVLALLIGGALALVAFVLHQLRTEQPLIEVRMFRVRTFSVSIGIICLVAIMQFGRLVFIPLELQNVRMFTALRVGVILTPAALGAAITMPIGGRLADRVGARVPVLCGGAILTIGAVLLARLSVDTSEVTIAAILGFQGLGTGLTMMPCSVAGLNSLPGRFVAQAAAVRNMNRQVAGAIGVAVLTAVVESRLGTTGPLPADIAPSAGQAAYNAVFVVGAIATAAAVVLALFLPGRAATLRMQRERAQEQLERDRAAANERSERAPSLNTD